MDQPNWTASPAYAGETPYTPPVPQPSPYELRPLAAGEILDRTLSIYRGNFWPLAGLSALSASVSVAFSIARLLYLHFNPAAASSRTFAIATVCFTVLHSLFYLLAYGFTLAAITAAVNSVYLGEATSLGGALHAARTKWARCLGVTIWQTWSAMWFFIFLAIPAVMVARMSRAAAVLAGILMVVGVLGGMVYGVIAYLRNSLAVPATVIEDLGVRAAMRRSKDLATGRIGRIFLLFLLVYALWMIAAVVEIPLGLVLLQAHGTQGLIFQGLVLGVNFLAKTLVGPLVAIGLCLFYFDERVRREGFDIDRMLRGTSAQPAETMVAKIGAEPFHPNADGVPISE